MPDAFAQLEDQDIDSRVVLDYTSRDFTAIRSQLVGLARGLMPEWETAGEASDFGTLLMEIFAYMGDVMHFYIDRTASEAFLGSAIRQQSVLYIANMLGYTPIGQQSASVTLQFDLDANATAMVTIPKGTRLHNAANNADDMIIFETDVEVILDPTTSPPLLSAIGYATEGIVQHDRFIGVCTGSPNTEFILPDKGVVYGSISVTSREGGQLVEWTYIANISLARPTQPLFTTFRDDQDFTHLVFGDNAAGRVPPVNAEIFVTYRYGVGAEANLLAPGAINTIVNSSGNNDWWGVSVKNTISPIGGTDPESVDAMRQSIPRAAARIKNRAITLHDYADMALQVPGVAKSVAHGTVYTAVRVKIAPVAGQGDDSFIQRLCAQVEDYMSDKVIIGSTVYAEPDTMDELWQNVYIRILVHVQKGYNRTSVRLTVDNTIRQILAFDNVDFGTRVTIGQIYRAALAVQGVEWAEVAWLSENITPPGLTQSSDIALFGADWNYDNVVTMADPGVREYRSNNPAAPTTFAFSTTTVTDVVRATELAALRAGDQILWQPVNDMTSWRLFVITAAPTVNSGWVQVSVAVVQTSHVVLPPTNGARVSFDFKRPAIQEVFDIDTDELLIPRITPPLKVKAATVSNVALTTNVATLTTTAAHGILTGETVSVTGVTPPLFNGQYSVTTVTANTLSYTKVNANVVSVAAFGTIATVNLPELETDYPGLTEEERTHDGLWVIADGGVLGS